MKSCPPSQAKEVDTTKMHVKGGHRRHTRKTGKCQKQYLHFFTKSVGRARSVRGHILTSRTSSPKVLEEQGQPSSTKMLEGQGCLLQQKCWQGKVCLLKAFRTINSKT
jgi:hypothetical protein